MDLHEMLDDESCSIRIINEGGVDLGWVLEEKHQLPCAAEVLEVLDPRDNNANLGDLLKFLASTNPDVKWLSINAIELTPAARGHGLGQRVIELLLRKYRQNGVDLVTFHTALDNEPMKKIGHKLGFTLLKVPDVKSQDSQTAGEDGRIFAVKMLSNF